jgi:hypothetical protein
MSTYWELPDALMGGTIAMRAAGEVYLPRESKEDIRKWENRRDRSVLYNAYQDSLDNLTSRPFSRQVSIKGDLPESLQSLEDNADGFGTTFHNFMRSCYYEAVHRGIVHILVDYPPVPVELTKAEEEQMGVRPYLRMVTAKDLIGWQFDKVSDFSIPQLTQIRIKETAVEPDGDYGDQEVDYVKVITREGWSRYRIDDGEDVLIDSGTHTFGRIYMTSIYFNKAGKQLLVAKPCLEGLAWMNLAHWQSYSDQKNILRFARTGLIFAKGLAEEEMSKPIVVGANAAFRTSNEVADMKYVEHGGSSIQAGERDIASIEEKMNQLGMQPFIASTKEETATGKTIDEDRNQSDIMTWIMAMEQGGLAALEMAHEWQQEEVDEELAIDIYSDFSVVTRGTTDLDTIDKGRSRGDISQATYLQELKRRDVLSEDVDVEMEVEDSKAEGMSNADTMPPPFPDATDSDSIEEEPIEEEE